MWLFRSNKPEIKGHIKYYNLVDWWLSTFTEKERTYIDTAYKPMGTDKNFSLIKGDIVSTTQTIGTFLSGLSTWFRKTEMDRDIARRILAKSVKVADPNKDTLGLHFTYQSLIEVWYRDRDSLKNALQEAIDACKGQIAIAEKAAKQFKKEYPKNPLPSHVGYTQLTIIYDKLGRYDEAIQIAKQAKQQGWNDDWDTRIEKYLKKKSKKTQ